MELVFMRHGKAEPRSDAKADFDRELTSVGQKKIKQAAFWSPQPFYFYPQVLLEWLRRTRS